jgi:hypothetical protein
VANGLCLLSRALQILSVGHHRPAGRTKPADEMAETIQNEGYMQNQRVTNRGLLALILALLTICPPTLAAQQPEAQQQNPLVTKMPTTDDQQKTIWDLYVPQRPSDGLVRITPVRMAKGLTLIVAQGGEAVSSFIREYEEKVRPEDRQAYRKAEALVIKYTNGEVLNGEVAEELEPREVLLVTDPEELLKKFGLDPMGDQMSRMDWGLSPIGSSKITERRQLLNNQEAIEAQIKGVYHDSPADAEAIIKAFRACAVQAEDSETCYNAKASDIKFLLRNHGRSGAGENESYLKGTNSPDARLTVFWVPNIGWKGNGWDCGGNFLQFFEHSSFRVLGEHNRGIAAPPKPPQASCELRQNGKAVTRDTPAFVLTPEQILQFEGSAKGGSANLKISSKWTVKGELWGQNPDLGGRVEKFDFGPKVTNYVPGTYPGLYDTADQFGNVSSCPFTVVVVRVERPVPVAPEPICAKCALQNHQFRVGKDGITMNVSDFVPKGTILKPGSVKWTINGSDVRIGDSVHISQAELNKAKVIIFSLDVTDSKVCVIHCEGVLRKSGSKWWVAVIIAAAAGGAAAALLGHKKQCPACDGGPGVPRPNYR